MATPVARVVPNRRARTEDPFYDSTTVRIGENTWQNETKLHLRREGNTFRQVSARIYPFQGDNFEMKLESGVRPELELQLDGHHLTTTVRLLSPFDKEVQYRVQIINDRGRQIWATPQQQVHLQATVPYSREDSRRMDQRLLDNESLTVTFVIQSEIVRQADNQRQQNININPTNTTTNNTNEWRNVTNIENASVTINGNLGQHYYINNNQIKIIVGTIILVVLVIVAFWLLYPLLSQAISCLVQWIFSGTMVGSMGVTTAAVGVVLTRQT